MLRRQWYVSAVVAALLTADPMAVSAGTELPEEVRMDVRRIYSMGEKFDRAHIDATCAEQVTATEESEEGKSPFRCFRTAYKKAVREKEPSVSGYVVLLSIGTVVLAEERQKILESGMNEGDQERELQKNSLDTAELLIETLERVAAKSRVIAQELPVAEKLRKTLRSRAEMILKARGTGRTPAAVSASLERGRRDELLSRLSDIDTE
jgi:hypothetical protein